MNKKIQFVAVSFIAVFLLAFSSSPPIGNTNAPGDGSCGNCHGGGSFPGNLFVDIFDNGSNIQFVTEFNTGVPTTYGWQWTILDDNDNPIGSWTSLPGSSSIQTSGNQEWLGHDPAVFDDFIWITDGGFWDPQGYCGEISLYTAVVTANGNGSTAGDEVHHNVFTHTIVCPLTGAFGDFGEPTCNGDCDGLIVASGNGGTPPYEYDWDDGQTTATATNLCAGDYVVTITDDEGETVVLEMNLGEPEELIGEETGLENAGCFGESNGLIQVTSSGGTGSLDYDWGPFGNDCCPFGLAAGTYGLTITDANGCEFIDSYEITEYPEITISFTTVPPSTTGADDGSITASATGGVPPFDYDWDTGDNTATTSGLEAGIYEVTVTDDVGCEIFASVSLMDGMCSFTINTIISEPNCYGGLGMITASTQGPALPPIEYEWSDGSDEEILIAPAGIYEVTATDDAGCQMILSGIVMSQPDSLDVVMTSLSGASCTNSGDGQLTVSILGGAEDYTMIWESGLTNDTIMNGNATIINLPDTLTNLSPGYFSYLLTDGDGCTRVDSFFIPNSDNISPVLTTQPVMIYIGANGTAGPLDPNLVVSSATDNCSIANIEVANSPAGYTCADIGSSMVTVTATDTNNNSITAQALVTVTDTVAPQLTCPQDFEVATCMAVFYDTPIVNDNCNSSITPELVEGLNSGTVFPAGTTRIVFQGTDLCGNIGTCSFNITVDVDLAINASTTPATCGLSDGTILTTISGGTPPYEIEPDISGGVSAGTFTLTVTDAGGCQAQTTVIVEQVGGPEIQLVDAISFCPGTSPSGSFMISNGVAPFDFFIDGVQVSSTNEPLVNYTLEGEGVFSLLVSDANGCNSNTLTVTTTELDIMEITVQDIDLGCAASLPVSQLQLPPGYSIQGNPSVLTTGTFTIVDDLCNVPSGTLTVIGGGMLAASAITTPSACSTQTGTVSIVTSGGTEPLTYSPFGPEQGGLIAGNYAITVRDATGCEVVVNFTIEQENGPSLSVQETTVCFGSTDGELTLSGMGGTPPYRYRLGSGMPMEGGSSFTFDGLRPGAYTVSVIDQNGCSDQTMAVVREHPELIIDAEVILDSDCMISLDEVMVNPTGGIMPYTINLSLEPDNSILINVVDGVGCEESSIIQNFQLDSLTASVSVDYNCIDNTPTPNFEIVGGCPPYETDFDQGLNTQVGEHIITITDNAGQSTEIILVIEDIGLLTVSAPLMVVETGVDPIIIENEINGGIAPFTYQWTDAAGNIISEQTDFGVQLDSSQVVTLTVIDSRGCISSTDVNIEISTSTIDLDVSDRVVQVYPSPVDDLLMINIKRSAPVEIQIMDMTGQIISTQDSTSDTVLMDVSNIAAGVYFIRMEFEDKIVLKRIIKS